MLDKPPTGCGVDKPSSETRVKLGCVSYLNAKPLIHGLDRRAGLEVRYNVPSKLLSDLETAQVDLALCPVVDYHRSQIPLEIVPAGAIGCAGKTLTVKLLSKTPIGKIDRVHVDSHSHTSVVLMRIILAEKYGLHPHLSIYQADLDRDEPDRPNEPQSLLLIGDKVVTRGSIPSRYRYQLDLGEAWDELTGLPFVFATWMVRAGTALGQVPGHLEQQRLTNAADLDSIAIQHAPFHGWPVALAQHYFRDLMRYDFNAVHLETLGRFSAWAYKLGFIDDLEPLRVYGTASTVVNV